MNSRTRTILLTVLAMTCFAGNSLLCRLALRQTSMDAASFTSIRLVSGAATLWLCLQMRPGPRRAAGNWPSGLALFAYAACFSFAYISLPAGTGALLLFGAVQATMIGYGLATGETLSGRRLAGLIFASSGLVGLLLPGLAAPPFRGAALMLVAGAAWGVYSLRGRGTDDATDATAGNFLRAVPFAIGLNLLTLSRSTFDQTGIGYAIASGALASGLGYAMWYAALRGLSTSSAAIVQLCVPVIAAAGGIALLGELPTLRLLTASLAILGGIALALSTCGRQDRGPTA